MAKGEMDDFLKKYYRHLHTASMPDNVLRQLVEDNKKGLLTGHQQEWFKDFLEPDPDAPYGYKAKKLPDLNDTSELFESELNDLYKRIAKAMAGMKNASIFYDTTNDADAIDFVKRWVDDRQLFPTPKATPECETGIQKLLARLDETSRDADPERIKSIKQVLLDQTKDKEDKPLFKKPDDIEKLLKKCRDGKHNSDTTVQDKIQRVARTLKAYLEDDPYSYLSNNNNSAKANSKQKNKDYLNDLSDDLDVIGRSDAFSNIEITADNIKKFRDTYGKDFLTEIYNNQNVRSKFADKDPAFVEIITKAEGKISWHDPKSEDYVQPKIDDVLTPLQQLQKWSDDTYKDTLKKYEELRGAHLFSSPHAKEICKAIDKVKIKPADGLAKLLEKSEEVKGKIDNTTVKQHFDWFVETMKGIKDKMPKAVDGCWQDAKQMKGIIDQIILKATDPRTATEDDMRKAETAMEIMTVMKYGMMTSKVMDAMRQSDFKVFSDGSLSWNKNEGIQFVTNAFDKSVKAAFLGIGYGFTVLKNGYKLRDIKYTDKDNKKGPLSERFNKLKSNLNDRRGRDKAALQQNIHDKQSELQSQNNDLDVLSNEVNATNREELNQRINDLKSEKERIEARLKPIQEQRDHWSQEMAKQQQIKDHLEENKNKYEEQQKIANGSADREQKRQINLNIGNLNVKIANKRAMLSAVPFVDESGNPITDPDEEKATRELWGQELAQLHQSVAEQQAQIQQLDDTFADRQTAARNEITRLQGDYDKYQDADRLYSDNERFQQYYDQQYNNIVNANVSINGKDYNYNSMSEKISQFEDATKKVEELNTTITEKQNALDNWDQEHVNKVLYLENYWNMLNGGESKTWRLFTSNAQDDFDNAKDQRMRRIMLNSRYGRVA